LLNRVKNLEKENEKLRGLLSVKENKPTVDEIEKHYNFRGLSTPRYIMECTIDYCYRKN